MKHGDKAKKSAKGKASGKPASIKVASPGKTSKATQGRSQTGSAKAAPVKAVPAKAAPVKAVPAKAAAKAGARPATGGNGKPVAVAAKNGGINFSNPVVGAAFKRAVKKYPTAFRKLTD